MGVVHLLGLFCLVHFVPMPATSTRIRMGGPKSPACRQCGDEVVTSNDVFLFPLPTSEGDEWVVALYSAAAAAAAVFYPLRPLPSSLFRRRPDAMKFSQIDNATSRERERRMLLHYFHGTPSRTTRSVRQTSRRNDVIATGPFEFRARDVYRLIMGRPLFCFLFFLSTRDETIV